jgi:hypothetical protein
MVPLLCLFSYTHPWKKVSYNFNSISSKNTRRVIPQSWRKKLFHRPPVLKVRRKEKFIPLAHSLRSFKNTENSGKSRFSSLLCTGETAPMKGRRSGLIPVFSGTKYPAAVRLRASGREKAVTLRTLRTRANVRERARDKQPGLLSVSGPKDKCLSQRSLRARMAKGNATNLEQSDP